MSRVVRLLRLAGVGLKRLLGRTQPRVAARLPRVLARGPRAPGPILRQILRSSRQLAYVQARAALNGLWHQSGRLGAQRPPTLGLRGLQGHYRLSGAGVSLDHIRARFYADAGSSDVFPSSLAAYELGSHIDKGCDAVVYEARLRAPLGPRRELWDLNCVGQLAEAATAPGVTCRNNDETRRQIAGLSERKGAFPLAIKMLFNYHYGTTDEAILRSAGRELVPASNADVAGLLRREAPLGPSPFVVRLHAAFVDAVPLLPGAEALYPAALPADPLFADRFGLDRTLFVVMKRYTMTLHQYLRQFHYSERSACVLVGQLLEGLRFLAARRVAHRDLKSNNVLLDFDRPDETPFLVISDFGHCLSGRRGLRVPFPSEDGVDVGGNAQLSPPEIRNARPGLGRVLDFSRSDGWAGGALGLEILTRANPFYARLSSADYREEELPALSPSIPRPLRRLLRAMLRRDPEKRPHSATAAAVSALVLFRGAELRSFLAPGVGRALWEKLQTGLELYAVETMLGALELVAAGPGYFARDDALSAAELQLRCAFLSRLDKSEIAEALPFFAD